MGGTVFPKCRAGLGYCLVLGPLFWECPTLGLYPTHPTIELYSQAGNYLISIGSFGTSCMTLQRLFVKIQKPPKLWSFLI
jgi:hypothetical protein